MAGEFYRFYQLSEGNSGTEQNVVRLTSGEDAVGGYTPTTMRRSELHRNGRVSENELRITFSIKTEFAANRVINRQEQRYWVEVARQPDATPFWRGRMRQANPSATNIILTFASLLGSLRQNGLPSHFQVTCRHVLYDEGCNVPRETQHSQTVDIRLISRLSNTIEIAPSGWPLAQAVNGILEQAGRHYLVLQTEANLLVLQHCVKLESGVATLWRGCDKALATCRDRFSNLENFGGYPNLPDGLLWGEDMSKFAVSEIRPGESKPTRMYT